MVDGDLGSSQPIPPNTELHTSINPSYAPSGSTLAPADVALDQFLGNALTAQPLSSSSPTEESAGTVDPIVQAAELLVPSSQATTLPNAGPSVTPLQTVPNPFASTLNRDALMSYAYHLYHTPDRPPPVGLTSIPLANPLPEFSTPEQVYKLRLLPLLTTLRSLHPEDLAILLLLSCTLHNLGQYDSSLSVNQEILRLDPSFVEAMNNIGMTMKALGRNDQAYEWWWRAIQLRPNYWNAIDNLLGLLLTLAHSAQDSNRTGVLYARALDVCEFVERNVLGNNGKLSMPVSPRDLPRLQKVLLTSAAIRGLNKSSSTVETYFRALELVISPPSAYATGGGYSTRELIIATFLAMYILQPSPSHKLPPELVNVLGLPEDVTTTSLLDSDFDALTAAREHGDDVLKVLIQLGGNALPFMLLFPEQAMRLPNLLFRRSGGALPAICVQVPGKNEGKPVSEAVRQETNVMTGTILLALAKRYQDHLSSEVSLPGFDRKLNVNHALSIMFYYLALSLFPSPSTYNNIGIVLSMLSMTFEYADAQGEPTTMDGSTLARVYYTTGLRMDPVHPHLLTNLGSLFKDQGSIEEAIQMYGRALEVKPDFDIALANMGNAIKDTGRGWEALEYYRRAVAINPDLPEAVCGLMNAMASVCDFRGRSCYADEYGVDDDGNLLAPTSAEHVPRPGFMKQMVDICERQLALAYAENMYCVSATKTLDAWLAALQGAFGRPLRAEEHDAWAAVIGQFYGELDRRARHVNEGGFVLRFINWVRPRLQRRWYIHAYGKVVDAEQDVAPNPDTNPDEYLRPALPRTMSPPAVPSLLPFNTFIYPLPPRIIRLIAHRNALRISFTALSQPWLPRHVYPPPPPPVNGVLNIGYVSNDVNNHPLSHLMQSVFGLHDRSRFKVSVYTTSPWDGTSYRPRISSDVELFVDAATWSSEQIVNHIKAHNIHVLINLGGYTKGARNDVFAARPCPVQMQLIGYAGSLGAGWCDYLVTDPIASPQELCGSEAWRKNRQAGARADAKALMLDADLDPEDPEEQWIYAEKFIYMPHTLMVTDHKQSFRSDENLSPEERAQTPVEVLWRNEELRRQQMRQEIFPDLSHTTVIFANFNQLYKIDPGIFAVWLRILARVPNSILWLLRFPAAGEQHLMRTARLWAGDEVAARIRFTDVARKDDHVHRGRVADLFLDTVECNAHTITADIIWPGTPIITFPKHPHKMCSRVAASMANATGFGDEMIVNSLDEYEHRAVALANSIEYVPETGADGVTVLRGRGALIALRRNLFLNRDRMPLFDTARWTRNIEKAYWEAWRRWVEGTQFELSDEWEACEGPEKESGCIWVPDDDPVEVVRYD